MGLVPAGQAAAEQGSLLRRAAGGDEQAFMSFYDDTWADVFALEVARTRSGVSGAADVRSAAENRARLRFVAAWQRAAEHESSGLSPLAWLLSLDVSPSERSSVLASETKKEVSCA